MDEISQILWRLAKDRSDEEAWTALYTRFRPFVFTLAYRRTAGAREFARDATQEVFFRLVKYCPFEKLVDVADFRGYLHTVTRNVAASMWRQQPTTETLSGLLGSIDAEWSEPVLTPHGETVELRELLRRALRGLPPEEQKVLALCLEGHTRQEIADRLGISVGNAAVRLHRIRAKLRANPLLAGLL